MKFNDAAVLPAKRTHNRDIAPATAIAAVCCALAAQGCGSPPASEGESVGHTAAALTFATTVNANPSSGPAAITSWGGGRQDVFWIGTDTTLYHAWSNDQGASWGQEPLFDGFLPGSTPGAVAAAPGRIDVAVIGLNKDVQHVWYNGTGFYLERMADWDPSGFIVSDQPSLQGVAISSPWPERIDLFFIAPDGAVHHRWSDQGWRIGNESLGGQCTTPPSASATVWNRIDIVCSNPDYSIDHRVYYDTRVGWLPWVTLSHAADSVPTIGWKSVPIQHVYSSPVVASSPIPDPGGPPLANITIAFIDEFSTLRCISAGVGGGLGLADGEFATIDGADEWTLKTFDSGAYAVAATNGGTNTDDFVVLDSRGYLSTANFVLR